VAGALIAMLILGHGCRRRPPVTQKSAADLVECDAAALDSAAPGGCDVVLEPYPRYDDQDALVFNDLPIRLFFFSQTPPADTEVIRPVRAKAVLASGSSSCRETGIKGLRSLQRLAVRHGANAVVNIRATWNESPLGNELVFGCRQVGARHALIWEGALATVPVPTEPQTGAGGGVDTAPDAGTVDQGEEIGAKLRKLQNLYYQGLITHEELLERRQEILNEL
jgi:hypothetical protein